MRKAKEMSGFRYIHLLSPCPPGWRFDAGLTVEIAKLAVETGIWPLYEIEKGKFRLTSISKVLVDKKKRKPVEEYLKLQGRFKDLKGEDVKRIQEEVDQMWEDLARM